MMAIVCRSYDGVKALETYTEGGQINTNSGFHGLAASVGKSLEGRHLVICLDSLRHVLLCVLFLIKYITKWRTGHITVFNIFSFHPSARRPYPGDFIDSDEQRRLEILEPRLPNGECPPGFLGYAVNMIILDKSNLVWVTPSGCGLRETLFYSLLSRLQVYKTRTEMLQALPVISDGAISLDGGMIKSCGIFSLGNR